MVGRHIALDLGAPFVIAVFMGMVTATAALSGALVYGVLIHSLGAPEIVAEVAGFGTAFALRASAIIFDIRMRPPGEFIRIGKQESKTTK